MKEIEEVENTPIEDLIERKISEYREMITKEAQNFWYGFWLLAGFFTGRADCVLI